MNISLIDYTKNARELLILSKNTRHLSNPRRFEEILDMSERQKEEELQYVFNTISSSWEFVNYTFLLQDVTRAFTHQLVRHRVGYSFAQQSMRVFPATAFSYLIPDGIEADQFQSALYNNAMMNTQESYNLLLDKGAVIQDARGVLPTNICTNILVGCNLRSLSAMMETRLCIRTQGEFQQVALQMKVLTEEVHPWARKVLLPSCVMKGVCAVGDTRRDGADDGVHDSRRVSHLPVRDRDAALPPAPRRPGPRTRPHHDPAGLVHDEAQRDLRDDPGHVARAGADPPVRAQRAVRRLPRALRRPRAVALRRDRLRRRLPPAERRLPG